MFMVQVHVCHATKLPLIAWQQSKDRGSNDFGMSRNAPRVIPENAAKVERLQVAY